MAGNDSGIEGKVALITGGGRGIGRGVVEMLAADGARIVLNDIDEGPAQEAADAARALGAEVVTVVGSVSDRDFGHRFVQAGLDAFGAIDIVVNNAGYATYAPAEETTDEDFDVVLDVLVAAPFRILRAAGKYFRDAAANGNPVTRKVVNVASIGGLMGAPSQIAYGAGKAGIIGLTNTLAMEWGKYNVNVNAVAPGITRTRLTEGPEIGIESITIDGREHALTGGGAPGQTIPLSAKAAFLPLNRIAEPQDIAGAVYYLSTRWADYITGETIVVDGGLRVGR
ncbi:SDR family NAD(P)-dependent oxidoreductase [Rhodococcoides yunnanense]|uniref:SDR family NAD(P)-dependent oxidoreductase n=1 Tax=Rhodococcoides yunnanense TaxID=278209 RepID=UPI000933536C|nr:SDR family oxidoreductase [Rhodococcus yunnanensis]